MQKQYCYSSSVHLIRSADSNGCNSLCCGVQMTPAAADRLLELGMSPGSTYSTPVLAVQGGHHSNSVQVNSFAMQSSDEIVPHYSVLCIYHTGTRCVAADSPLPVTACGVMCDVPAGRHSAISCFICYRICHQSCAVHKQRCRQRHGVEPSHARDGGAQPNTDAAANPDRTRPVHHETRLSGQGY
jgi:hypothetical protein